MIRKTIIAGLTLAAALMAVLLVHGIFDRTVWTSSGWFNQEPQQVRQPIDVIAVDVERFDLVISTVQIRDTAWTPRGYLPLLKPYGWSTQVDPSNPRLRLVIFRLPLWLMFLASAVYPVVAFIRGPLRRWRRKRRGLCVGCGYNLIGTVTGVCSECGARITWKPRPTP